MRQRGHIHMSDDVCEYRLFLIVHNNIAVVQIELYTSPNGLGSEFGLLVWVSMSLVLCHSI